MNLELGHSCIYGSCCTSPLTILYLHLPDPTILVAKFSNRYAQIQKILPIQTWNINKTISPLKNLKTEYNREHHITSLIAVETENMNAMLYS